MLFAISAVTVTMSSVVSLFVTFLVLQLWHEPKDICGPAIRRDPLMLHEYLGICLITLAAVILQLFLWSVFVPEAIRQIYS